MQVHPPLATNVEAAVDELYTDDEWAIHKAKRPVIVNGIPRLAEREDLASRTFTISLPPMTGDRLTEPELLQRWQGARPRILAGLLDGVCCAAQYRWRHAAGRTGALSALKWAVAAEPNFGFDDGEVFKAYQDSARETTQARKHIMRLFRAGWARP